MKLNTALISSILISTAIAFPALARAAPRLNQVEVLTNTGTKILTEEDKSLLQLKITRAGVDIAPEYFRGLQAGLAALLTVVILIFALISPKMLFLLIAVPIGYFLPVVWLNGKIERRKAEFRNRLDDFVLYLSTALTSSPELILSIQEAGRATGGVYEEEISRVVKENSLGKNLTDALLDMAYRVDEEEVGSLLNLISQSSIYGGSIADKMQSYADKLREGKRYDIMDQAAKLSIKLVFIVTFFMLIPVLMAIGFPTAWTLIEAL